MTYVIALAGGFLGSLHCVGMCGGFPLALAAGDPRARLGRQLLYNAGRLNTLVVVGALSGLGGAALVRQVPVAWTGRALAVAAGVVMIVVGLEMLGLLDVLTRRGAAIARATVGQWLGAVIRSRSLAAPVALGVFNALLPCQLIYAFAARAAATASVSAGMLTMLAFGLGTVPAMLAVGLGGARVPAVLRGAVDRAGAVLVIVFGAVTAARGLVAGCPH